jgi:hypothetical protein
VGELRWKPTEAVPLHVWNAEKKAYEALPVEEMGKSGVIELLEQADLLSGRGEHDTLYASLQAAAERNRANRALAMEIAKEGARETAWLHYPRLAGVESVTVPVDLENNT